MSLNSNGKSGIGALVIGGDYQGLGIVRSLGRQGIPVGVIDDEISIAPFSRYTTFTERASSLKSASDTIGFLHDIGKRRNLKGWVLYPTRDETVDAISRNREDLANLFRIPTPSPDVVQWLWDKRRTYALAKRLGIPAPATWCVQTEEELDQLDCNFPVALKPAIKEHFIYVTRAKAWRADNLKELHSLFRRARQFLPAEEIMIQDFIPGKGDCQYAYCSFFKRDRSIASLVARRLRQHPSEFGRASTYVESLEVPCLEKMSEAFLQEISYYGLVEIEYKFDQRDNTYKLLDANARTWGYNSIGASAGVDFPFLLFLDQINREIPLSRGKPGIRWVRLLTDLPTAVAGIIRSDIKSRDYFRSLVHADTEAVFSLEDCLPGLVECALAPYLLVKRGY